MIMISTIFNQTKIFQKYGLNAQSECRHHIKIKVDHLGLREIQAMISQLNFLNS